MDALIFLIVIIQLIVIMVLSVLNFKENILNFMLGIRRKKVVFLDLRTSKTITLSKDLKTFEYMGKTFVWNFRKELNGTCFFRSDNSEALDAELNIEKCLYWCDSNEYHTNLKNKLLETMMMLKNKDQIIQMLMIGLILSIAVLGLVYVQTKGIQDVVNDIQISINSMNQTSEIVIR